MIIMGTTGTTIVNSERAGSLPLVTLYRYTTLLVAGFGSEKKGVTIAKYEDMREAKEAMAELFDALAGGQKYYTMPDSRKYHEEKIKKDARTRRKGGS